MSAYITKQELRAVYVAWDELVSYIDTVGQEGALDDEEMPSGVLHDAERDLRYLLARNGLVDVAVAAAVDGLVADGLMEERDAV